MMGTDIKKAIRAFIKTANSELATGRLDLHGNAKKKETCPDGSKDENVFDIMQGVAIFLGVKS